MRLDKTLMLLGALLLAGVFFFPIWNITLEAPQYPTPLGMDIHVDRFADAHAHDIKNINLMNHYVGMQFIPDTIPEFEIFPWVVGLMIGLGVLIALFGDYKLFWAWFVLMSILGMIGLYDFYMWEYDYGHSLDPKAIMNFKNPDGSVMGFQPPLWGSKKILNFHAHSYPRAGAVFMFAGMGLTFLAGLVGFLKRPKKQP